MSKNKSEDALNGFGHHWESERKLRWNFEAIAIVVCHVTYFMKGRKREVETEVQFYHNEMKIEINDNEWLNSLDHYTGFCPEYQTFSFKKETGTLRIDGSGPKLGGKYWLEITPKKINLDK